MTPRKFFKLFEEYAELKKGTGSASTRGKAEKGVPNDIDGLP